jgi:hypothetical protein
MVEGVLADFEILEDHEEIWKFARFIGMSNDTVLR